MANAENIADALPKAVSFEMLNYHADNSSAEYRRDRHRMAPEVAGDDVQKSRVKENKSNALSQGLQGDHIITKTTIVEGCAARTVR